MSVLFVVKVSFELAISLGIKLFIENGRIHPEDFVDSFLFWLPGHTPLPGNGLSRQVERMLADTLEEDAPVFMDELPLAAK